MVTFINIPITRRLPGVLAEFDSSRALRGLAIQPYKILVVAQKLADGSWPALQPTRVSSVGQAIAGAGEGSMAHAMAMRLFDNNTLTEAWFIVFDDPAGAQAEGEILFGGTPTVAGTVYVYIANHRIQVPVLPTDTPTTLGSALEALINADGSLPVTADATAGAVTITAKHQGVVGNDIDLRHSYLAGEALPAGLTVGITPMADGTGNVDVANLWPALKDEWFNVIAFPYRDTSNIQKLEAEIASRLGPERSIDAYALAAHPGDHAALLTFGETRNSPGVSWIASYGSPTPTYEVAAMAAGQVAQSASSAPQRPFNTVPLVGMGAPLPQARFTQREKNQLLYAGITPLNVDGDGTVRIARLVTSYQVNSLGTEDPSLLDATTPFTLSYLRFSWRAYMAARYSRANVGSDEAIAGPGVVILTPSIGRAEALAVFELWRELGLVDDPDGFRRGLVVEVNAQDKSRMDFFMPPDIVNGLHILATQIGFVL